MTDESSCSRKVWRPRMSLLTALLLMTIAAMAITDFAMLWREVGPLRIDNRRMRDELGELSIEDRSKIHAIQVRTGDDLKWKWRVWVPAGENVVVRFGCGDVPRAGLPEGNGRVTLRPGECWITLAAKRDHKGEHWLMSMETSAGGGIGIGIRDDQKWPEWTQICSTTEGVGFTTLAESGHDKTFLH